MAFQLRRRVPDALVTIVAVALCAAPFVATTQASLVDVPIVVDQKVRESAVVSKPLQGNFDSDRSGKSVGKLDWEVYTSAGEGFKLTVATDKEPAFRDSGSTAKVDDYSSTPVPWSVGAGERKFGFSAEGDRALGVYDQGTKWRGFNGTRGIEVARRRTGPARMTRTTIWLTSEMRNPLPSDANPEAFVTATASVNL